MFKHNSRKNKHDGGHAVVLLMFDEEPFLKSKILIQIFINFFYLRNNKNKYILQNNKDCNKKWSCATSQENA